MNSIDLQRLRPDVDVGAIKATLDATPMDHHYADKGDYRYRSMSRLKVEADGTFSTLPRLPLFQSSAVNRVDNYGGIARDYDDLPAALREEPSFHRLLHVWMGALPEPVEVLSVHHIRTFAPGVPVPEGRHRDGYKWIGVYVAQRRNIDPDTGRTTFWLRGGDEVVMHDVAQEGELLVFNDRKFTHTAGPIERLDKESPGIRDVFIITLPEHGAIVTEEDEVQ